MRIPVMALLAFLNCGSYSLASIEVVLTPEQEALPFTTVDIAIGLRQSPGSSEILLRLLSFDFSQSRFDMVLNDFTFDFPETPQGFSLYYAWDDLPRPQAAFVSLSAAPFLMFRVPGDGSILNVGWLNVTLPYHHPYMTTYIDALSPMDPGNPSHGAILAYGFGVTDDDPYVELTPGHGLTGGRLVIPEPGTAILHVALLSMLMLTRRRSGRTLRLCPRTKHLVSIDHAPTGHRAVATGGAQRNPWEV